MTDTCVAACSLRERARCCQIVEVEPTSISDCSILPQHRDDGAFVGEKTGHAKRGEICVCEHKSCMDYENLIRTRKGNNQKTLDLMNSLSRLSGHLDFRGNVSLKKCFTEKSSVNSNVFKNQYTTHLQQNKAYGDRRIELKCICSKSSSGLLFSKKRKQFWGGKNPDPR